MKLIFISSGSYPDGGAASNRHLAYTKGLFELGHKIEFILLEDQHWKEPEIELNGIIFTCVSVNPNRKLSKIGKINALYKTISKAKHTIRSTHERSEVTAIILLDTRVIVLIPLLMLGKKLGLKVFHERTEFPLVVARKTFLSKIDLYIYLKFVLRKFDGIYVINNALKKYFLELTKRKIKIKVINMIVDPSRFEFCKKESGNNEKTLTYCGGLEGDKDGVPILIEAFSIIADEFPSLRLQLIGSTGNEISRQRLLSIAKKNKIDNKLVLLGPRKRDEIPKLLCNSDILVLARPNNMQAIGGFPTKLGEYLATGNPVIVTNVGEIGLFLKDKINAFVSEPDSAEKFADKIREALVCDKAYIIGIEGRKLVYNEFNYLTQAKNLEKMFA